MLGRDIIGTRWPPHSVLVEHGRLRLFAEAVGAPPAAAGDRPRVPPTLLFGLDLDGRPGERLAAMGVDLRRVLHGEQAFTYHRPAYAGDTLTFETTITDLYERRGGALQFIVLDTRVTNQHAEHVADMRCVTVVRNG